MILKRRNSNQIANNFFVVNANSLEPKDDNRKYSITMSSSPSSSKRSIENYSKCDKDLQISRYPLLEYIVSLSLLLFAFYVFASIGGITWGLPGFSEKLWWHFAIGGVCIAFSIGVMFSSDCQTFAIIKRQNLIIHQTSKFFCILKNIEEHKISEIANIQLLQSGAARKVSLHSRWYGSEISFQNCKRITVLKCISEQNAELYRQKIISVLDPGIRKRIEELQVVRI